MNYKHLLKVRYFAAIVTLFCVSCATGPSGPTFTPVAIPPGKTLLYVYMLTSENPGQIYTIKVDGQSIGDLKWNSYIPYITTPGKHKISSDTRYAVIYIGAPALKDKSITVDCESGKSQFVHYSGLVDDMEWVRNETGESDIAQCRLMK